MARSLSHSSVTFSRLEEACQAGDSRGFAEMVRAFSWEDAPRGQWVGAANMAFSLGLTPLTRDLVAQARQRWPEDDELRRFSEILAPPAIATRARRGDERDQDWIARHGSGHAGRWVALRQGELLAEATTLQELRDQIAGKEGVFVTRLLP